MSKETNEICQKSPMKRVERDVRKMSKETFELCQKIPLNYFKRDGWNVSKETHEICQKGPMKHVKRDLRMSKDTLKLFQKRQSYVRRQSPVNKIKFGDSMCMYIYKCIQKGKKEERIRTVSNKLRVKRIELEDSLYTYMTKGRKEKKICTFSDKLRVKRIQLKDSLCTYIKTWQRGGKKKSVYSATNSGSTE